MGADLGRRHPETGQERVQDPDRRPHGDPGPFVASGLPKLLQPGLRSSRIPGVFK
jgi:hypothetical protein